MGAHCKLMVVLSQNHALRSNSRGLLRLEQHKPAGQVRKGLPHLLEGTAFQGTELAVCFSAWPQDRARCCSKQNAYFLQNIR